MVACVIACVMIGELFIMVTRVLYVNVSLSFLFQFFGIYPKVCAFFGPV